MILGTNWRERLPVAGLLTGIVSLCVFAAIYLVVGRIDRPGLVFLLLGIALVGFYVIEDFETVTGMLRGRHARYGGNTAAMILLFIAIVAVLNIFASRHSFRLDLTEAREFSLSTQTTKVLQSLDKPVQVNAFFRPADYSRMQVEDLLKEYRRQNDKIQFEFIDWEARPGDALQYKLQSFPVVVMESGGRRQDVTGFSEQDLTSGIFKVSQGAPKKVVFTTGHGEPDINSQSETDFADARQALEASNYQVETINLAATATIDGEVGAVVINAPETALLDEEKQTIRDYMGRGGKVMVLHAPKRTADMSAILEPYGVQLADGVAIDVGQSLQRQPFVPVITSYPDFSPITRDIAATRQYVLMPLSTQINVAPPTGVSVSKLLETSDESWLATDDKDPNYREGDLRGPLTVGVAVTADSNAPLQGDQQQSDQNAKLKARLVVFSSADFATNMAFGAFANQQLFVNAVNWLTEEEDLISIRPQPPIDRTLILTGTQANLLVYSSVIFLPLAIAAAGAVVWWRRR